jgi:hypothetical protein
VPPTPEGGLFPPHLRALIATVGSAAAGTVAGTKVPFVADFPAKWRRFAQLRISSYIYSSVSTNGFCVAHVMLVTGRAGGLPNADLQGLGDAIRISLFSASQTSP